MLTNQSLYKMFTNKTILTKANESLQQGDIDTFLSFCTEDTEWVFVGDKTLKGKEAVRLYLEESYTETTKFNIERMIEEGDFVMQMGEISFENTDGEVESYLASDLWRFQNGKMADLKAFVIKIEN